MVPRGVSAFSAPFRWEVVEAARHGKANQLLGNAADDLIAAPVAERLVPADQPCRCKPAEQNAALQKQNICARSCRGNRRRDARDSAADNQHLVLFPFRDGDFCRCHVRCPPKNG